MTTANWIEKEVATLLKPKRERLWDLPTRIMHWLLVACIGVCWWTGTHNQLEYHLYSGYGALWIILMRLYWGFAGSSTARFAHFVRGPRSILQYSKTLHRRGEPHNFGHNPLGAISVLLMLIMVGAVIGLGLFAVDVDGLYSGPLSSYVSFRQGRHIAHLHYHWFEYLLWAIGLHLVAIGFYYFYKRQNLVGPMISGSRIAAHAAQEKLVEAPFWRFALGAIVITVFVWAVTTGFYF